MYSCTYIAVYMYMFQTTDLRWTMQHNINHEADISDTRELL